MQAGLFDSPDDARSVSRMAAIDALNRRYGRGTVAFGTSGEGQGWTLRREFISPRYTTGWSDMLCVTAHHISVAKGGAGEPTELRSWRKRCGCRRAGVRSAPEGRLRPRRTMNLKRIVVIAALCVAMAAPVSVQAGGWGRGPNIRGWHPLSQPIPRKPLAGAQMAAGDVQKAVGKAGTDFWDATKRPFVETAKFLKDPLAGPKRAINDAIDKAKAVATALGWQMVVWLSVGFGAAMIVAMLIGMGFAALFFRRREPAGKPA